MADPQKVPPCRFSYLEQLKQEIQRCGTFNESGMVEVILMTQQCSFFHIIKLNRRKHPNFIMCNR